MFTALLLSLTLAATPTPSWMPVEDAAGIHCGGGTLADGTVREGGLDLDTGSGMTSTTVCLKLAVAMI